MTDDPLKQIIEYLRRGCSLPQAFDYYMVVDRGMDPANVLLLRDSCSEPRSIRASAENAGHELGTFLDLDWTDDYRCAVCNETHNGDHDCPEAPDDDEEIGGLFG